MDVTDQRVPSASTCEEEANSRQERFDSQELTTLVLVESEVKIAETRAL